MYNAFANDNTSGDSLEKCKKMFGRIVKDFGKIQSLGKKG